MFKTNELSNRLGFQSTNGSNTAIRSNKNIFGKFVNENAVWGNRLLKAFQNLAWFPLRPHPLVSEVICHAFG